MKGFTKGKGKGKKFIPTSKKKGLTKNQIRGKKTLPISKKNEHGFVPEHTPSSFQYQSSTARLQGNKQPLGEKLGSANGIRGNDQLHPKGDWRKVSSDRSKQSLDPTQDDFESDPKVEKMIVELDEKFNGFPQSIPQIREFFADKKYTETEINRLVGNLRNLGFSFDGTRSKKTLEKKENVGDVIIDIMKEDRDNPITEGTSVENIFAEIDRAGDILNERIGEDRMNEILESINKKDKRSKMSLDEMTKRQHDHINEEIEIGLKHRSNPADIESITERLGQAGGGVGLDDEQMLYFIKKHPEARKTLLKYAPDGGFLGEPTRSKQSLDTKSKLKKGDPMCTQCGRQQKTKGKCEYCGCKDSYC